MRFTIRDLFWLMAVVGLVTALLMQQRELTLVRSSAALNQRRIRDATSLLNEYGYLVLWSDDDSIHGACNTYPHPVRVGDPVHEKQGDL